VRRRPGVAVASASGLPNCCSAVAVAAALAPGLLMTVDAAGFQCPARPGPGRESDSEGSSQSCFGRPDPGHILCVHRFTASLPPSLRSSVPQSLRPSLSECLLPRLTALSPSPRFDLSRFFFGFLLSRLLLRTAGKAWCALRALSACSSACRNRGFFTSAASRMHGKVSLRLVVSTVGVHKLPARTETFLQDSFYSTRCHSVKVLLDSSPTLF
jgi:hypothetical protein